MFQLYFIVSTKNDDYNCDLCHYFVLKMQSKLHLNRFNGLSVKTETDRVRIYNMYG